MGKKFHQFTNGQFVTEVLSKANICNTFFLQKCTDIVTSSTVPYNPSLISIKRLTQIGFDVSNITNIISKPNSENPHGHDGMSIRMIQL